ncbi:2-dehydro-3-deoxyphosphogluconate aldolase [Candidatus Acidianus copahuensis]|uniref:2-dehydro-3-deoxyphosphogluconate aldolase n=1 Tax=Candidatus Acidianus copahuensis TaxID=1160895 RepID=A0A031LPP7_9CREN|nr:bifunctional 2-dehydro-3-deoxy-phosphogluconate/2-dehydro-3-deoxy-6-phosphogalactonate aldolase [Candidatus Acidianus copahuensis]EZQ07062.1 2-dehydro-3-deoxyphosphogluconate aldolase [Candidatus Acidianus copahuensis]
MEIVVPIVTPFTSDGKIDETKVRTHVENLLKKGVDIIFVNGTTGLGPALSAEEKRKMFDATIEVTDKVIFQVGSLNLSETMELVSYANKKDLIAVASYPPYYFSIPKEFIVKYFKDICSKSSNAVYLYNYPSATGKDVDADMVKEIGCISGVKDTNPDFAHTLRYKELGIKTYNGSDSLAMTSMASGLDGTVSGAGNYAPEILNQIRESLRNGDVGSAIKNQFVLIDLVNLTKRVGQFSAIYELVEEFQGYSVGYPRDPIYPLSKDSSEKLREEARKIWKK